MEETKKANYSRKNKVPLTSLLRRLIRLPEGDSWRRRSTSEEVLNFAMKSAHWIYKKNKIILSFSWKDSTCKPNKQIWTCLD